MHLSEITKVHLREITKAKSVSYGLSWIAKADIVISCSEPAGLKPCQLPQRQTQVAQPPPKKNNVREPLETKTGKKTVVIPLKLGQQSKYIF